MYIPENKRITSLDELIDECKQIYTGWCFRGKKDLSLTSRTGKFSTHWWDTFHNSCMGDEYLLNKICNPLNDHFGLLNFLWLRYDSKEGRVSIYRRIMRDTKEAFLVMKTRYRPCNIKIGDFNSFCSNHGFRGEILPIMTSDNRVFGEVFVISASVANFANAGWQEEYDRTIAEKENSRRIALEQGRRKIALAIPLADKFYHSKLMKEMGISGKYRTYSREIRLTTLGTYAISDLTTNISWDAIFLFSQHGYRNISSEEEFIAFVVAYACIINRVRPSELKLDQVDWAGEICHDEDGIMYIYESDLPTYSFSENTPEKSSITVTPALKDLLD